MAFSMLPGIGVSIMSFFALAEALSSAFGSSTLTSSVLNSRSMMPVFSMNSLNACAVTTNPRGTGSSALIISPRLAPCRRQWEYPSS